ncbi:hypothetical protein KQX54_007165 [Cotesia glomerata]|uniref:Uncharacterized protein n=1 Tax=Cotesia glomerata TaxID=32391 RepID=A0AAV7HW66_COTGL|nr:hypothetical protein KQX54_007165 [Cotesia glomerata]
MPWKYNVNVNAITRDVNGNSTLQFCDLSGISDTNTADMEVRNSSVKSFSAIQNIFIQMQFENTGKNPRARRFSTPQKLLSLIIHERTQNFDTGIAPVITRHLRNEDERLASSLDRYVTIIWDEALQRHRILALRSFKDKIFGFERFCEILQEGTKLNLPIMSLWFAAHSRQNRDDWFVPIYHGVL